MYADEESLQPDEVAHEIRGQSSDINSGKGGKYVIFFAILLLFLYALD